MGPCPGLGWDGVHFLPSSWYSAGFQIQYVNNVDNTLSFGVAKQCLINVKDLSGSHALPLSRYARMEGSTSGQPIQTGHRDVHTIEFHPQYINWGVLVRRGNGLGHRAAGEQVY